MATHTRIVTRALVLVYENGYSPACAVQIAGEEISAPPSAHRLARRVLASVMRRDVRRSNAA